MGDWLKRFRQALTNQKGFTLIELMAVLAILALILLIAVPAIGGIISKSKTDSQVASVSLIEHAAELADLDGLPLDAGDTYTVPALVDSGYLKLSKVNTLYKPTNTVTKQPNGTFTFNGDFEDVAWTPTPSWSGAVPVGVTDGAGAYSVRALALAGLVGTTGVDADNTLLTEHGKQVWSGAPTAARDSLGASLATASAAEPGLVDLQGDYISFVEGQIATSAATVTSIAINREPASGKITMWNASNFSDVYVANDTLNAFTLTGGLFRGVQVYNRYDMFLISYVYNIGGTPMSVSNTVFKVTKGDNLSQYNDLVSRYQAARVSGADAMLALAESVGVNTSIVNKPNWEANYGSMEIKMRESWQKMRDTGAVFPVNSSVPLDGSGNPLTFDAETGIYTGLDGNAYIGAVSWLFAQPKIRSGQAGIPDGVYVDTPVLTGVPAYDDPIVANPAIPKTTTNIFTGELFENPDTLQK